MHKVTKYQRAGLVLNPSMPKLDTSSLQFQSPANTFGNPFMNQGPPQYQLKSKMMFGPNYNHIANSEFAQSIGAYLVGKKKEQDARSYDRLQSNPLLSLPGNPNTSQQSLYGMDYMKKGGKTKHKSIVDDHDADDEDYMKKGGWLKGAVNPAHKGYCTPMTKSTCTGHRRAFALMMKKKHGFHKKQQGGPIEGVHKYFAFNSDGAMNNNVIIDMAHPSQVQDKNGKPVIMYNYRTSDNKQGTFTRDQLEQYKKQYGYKEGKDAVFYGSNVNKSSVDMELNEFLEGGAIYADNQMQQGPAQHKMTHGQLAYLGETMPHHENHYFQQGGTYASYDVPGANVRQLTPSVNYANLYKNTPNPDSSQFSNLFNQRDATNDYLSTGKLNRSVLGNVPIDYLNHLYLFNQRDDIKNLSPEQKIQTFYNTAPNNSNAASEWNQLKGLAKSNNRPDPTIHFQYGGDVMEQEIEKDILDDQGQPVKTAQENTEPQDTIQPEEQFYEDQIRDPNRFSSSMDQLMDNQEDDTNDNQNNSDVSESGTTSNGNSSIESFKKGIAKSEGADYFTGNKNSSAFGKYQILKGTRENIREQFFSSISKKDFEDAYRTNPQFQEKVMDAYGSHLLKTFGNNMDVAATAWFLGPGKANMYNQPNYRPTPNNSTVGEYLNQFHKGSNYRLGGTPNKKLYREGGYYMVDSNEVEKLKRGGYQIEIY